MRNIPGFPMSEHLSPLLLPFRPALAGMVLRSAPRWFFSFCILAAAAVLLEFVTHTRDVSETLAHLPSSATAEEREVVRADLDSTLPLRAAILPLQHLAAWSVRAILLTLLLHAFGTGVPPRTKHLMSIAVGSGAIDTIERLAQTMYAGISDAGAGEALVLPWSLLALTGPTGSYALTLLLTSINMFTLWYVGTVGWALSVLCSVHKHKAVLIAGAVWAVSAGSTIVLLDLLRNAYAFSP